MAAKKPKAQGPLANLLGCTSSLISFILFLVIAPVFLLLWLAFTITGIGPLLNLYFSRRDKKLLSATIKSSSASPGEDEIGATTTDHGTGEAVVEKMRISGRSLAVRWSPGKDASLPPVCIPNGLGATLITIAGLHDVLEARGYPVLSYDRAGVGLSDPMPASWGGHATSEHVVEDMKAIMTQAVPIGGKRQWVLVGPSMGSIVAQCYMAKYPADVAGFLNVDGFPFPFAAKRAKFVQAATVYRVASSVVWTGVLRFFISMAGSFMKKLASAHFKGPVIQAQMNEANFTGSLAKEMITMMDLADTALQAWGPAFDIGSLAEADREALMNTEPSACGDITSEGPEFKWEDLPRSDVEAGEDWVSRATSQAVVDRLYALAVGGGEKEGNLAPLPRLWPRLVVRALSARHYDFGAASNFYDDEMKGWAAAEHNLHVLLSKDGKRLVFPKRSHDQMFFGLLYMMARQVDEITTELSGKKGLPSPIISSGAVEMAGGNQV